MNKNRTAKQSITPKIPALLIALLLLPVPILVFGTYWSGLKVNDISGPTLLSQDGSGNIYIIEHDKLLVTDPNGELMEEYPLKGYGIKEPLSDIYATREGNVIFGLRKSNAIKEYVRGGGEPLVYNITPVSETMDGYGAYFHFTMDEDYGTLYVTDSNEGSLNIYDYTGKLLNSLRTPSGGPPSQKQVSGESPDTLGQLLDNIRNSMPGINKRTDINFPYNWPNTVVLKDRSLYVADTNNFRIIKMSLDGQLEDVILADPLKGTNFGRITSFSVLGGRVYALFKNTVIKGGMLVRIDAANNDPVLFKLPGSQARSFDPDDIIATSSGVLVSDSSAFTIHEFSLDGQYVGPFGAKSLKKAFRHTLALKSILRLARYGMAAIAMMLLVMLIFVNERHKRKVRRFHQS